MTALLLGEPVGSGRWPARARPPQDGAACGYGDGLCGMDKSDPPGQTDPTLEYVHETGGRP